MYRLQEISVVDKSLVGMGPFLILLEMQRNTQTVAQNFCETGSIDPTNRWKIEFLPLSNISNRSPTKERYSRS